MTHVTSTHEINHRTDGTLRDERWTREGAFHREDGPAVIFYYPDGSVSVEIWWLNGQLHREGGPAYIAYRLDGSVKYEEWHTHGIREDR